MKVFKFFKLSFDATPPSKLKPYSLQDFIPFFLFHVPVPASLSNVQEGEASNVKHSYSGIGLTGRI